MSVELCGVCNEEMPIEHVCLSRPESRGKYTYYHISCESKIPTLPCGDCGKHKLFCNECKE